MPTLGKQKPSPFEENLMRGNRRLNDWRTRYFLNALAEYLAFPRPFPPLFMSGMSG
jgi:hypothetical protein